MDGNSCLEFTGMGVWEFKIDGSVDNAREMIS